MKKYDFAQCLTNFFAVHLPGHLNVSKNTICSYRDTFSKLLKFFKCERRILPEKLSFSHFSRTAIEDFLLAQIGILRVVRHPTQPHVYPHTVDQLLVGHKVTSDTFFCGVSRKKYCIGGCCFGQEAGAPNGCAHACRLGTTAQRFAFIGGYARKSITAATGYFQTLSTARMPPLCSIL